MLVLIHQSEFWQDEILRVDNWLFQSVKRRESPISTPPVQTPTTPNYPEMNQAFTGYPNIGPKSYPQESYPAENYPQESYPQENSPAESYPEVNSPVLISQSMQKMDLGQSPSPAMDSGIQVKLP